MTTPHSKFVGRPTPSPSTRRTFLTRAAAAGLGAGAVSGTGLTVLATPVRAEESQVSGLDFTTPGAFDAVEDYLDGRPSLDANNQEGILGWQTSAIMQAYVQMYLARRDLEYLERFIVRADAVLLNRDNELGIVDDDGLSRPGWSHHHFPELGGPIHPPVQTGMITRPLAWFARIILTTPELSGKDRYRSKAETYLQAAKDAVAIHDDHWQDLPDGTGIYSFPKGTAHANDGIQCAFNQNHTLGMTLMNLAAVTGDPGYSDKVIRMAHLFKSDLNEGASGAYIWSYQWTGSWGYTGWDEDDDVSVNRPEFGGNPRQEDFSHGALSMEFVNQAFWEGIVFNGDDLARFARAFDNALVETDYGLDVTRFLDGSGGLDSRWHAHAGTWACLSRWNDQLVPSVQVIYDHYALTQGVSRTTSMLMGISQLNRAAAGGRPHPGGPFDPED